MAIALNQQRCVNHPERAGKALCMQCKKTVCQECATTWDGINYCVNCLKQRRVVSEEGSSVFQWLGVSAAVILLMAIVCHLAVWAGVVFIEMAGSLADLK